MNPTPTTSLLALGLLVLAADPRPLPGQAPTWARSSIIEPRSAGALCWDAARQRVVMFGGFGVATPPRYDETWEWDGALWTLRNPATKPPGRRDHQIVYDSARQRIVMWGGN